ncbi:MAG: hypothetical protein IJQ52_01405 [Bacteroidales bacterium]|nr:hypothetical protein [Bacteroidales bacterium]
MKKFLLMLLPMAALLVSGCRFDDSDIWDELNDHETRILAIENVVNNDLASISAIVAALNQKVYVENVATVDGGFTITFTNGKSYTVTNGEAGHTPLISVKQDEDGAYYWTVDGEWLLDSGNEKVRADAIAPKVKLENDKWYISTDNGVTWVEAGPAATDPIFKSVSQENGYLILTLQNDETITLPMAELMKKLQLIFDESLIKSISAGATATAPYEVIVPEGETFDFDTFENNGYTVNIIPANDEGLSGEISVTAPDPAIQGKVLFILTGSEGSTFVKTVTINANPAIYVPTTYDVDYQAGSFEIAVSANVPYTSEIEAGVTWLHKGPAENAFTIDANEDEFNNRTANITFSAAGVNPVVVALTQSAKYAIVLDSQTATVGANDAGFEIAIRTNTVVTATSDVTWMAPVEATKAAHPQKVFEFTLEANTGDAREGHITFSAGDVQQTVTVTQQSATGGDFIVATIEQFNAAAESDTQVYELVGTIDGTINTTYGNFDLTDATGTVYVYGLTSTNLGYGAKNDKSYSSLGLVAGDNIKIHGYRGSYNNKIEVVYAWFIEKVDGGDVPTITASDITGVAAEGVTGATTNVTITNGEGWTPSVSCDGTVVYEASILNSVITYSVNGNQGAARQGKITVTLSKTGETSVSKEIKVSQQAASSGDETILWAEDWTGGEKDETPETYGQEGTTVYGSATVTYSITSGDTNTKLYNDNQMDGATSQLNLLLGKSGKTWTISGIPTGGATSATLKFYVNNGNTAGAAGFTVTTSTEGVTLGDKTKGTEAAKPFSFTYDITIGQNVSTFDLTFTNGASSNVRLDDLCVYTEL